MNKHVDHEEELIEKLVRRYMNALMKKAKRKQLDPIKTSLLANKLCCLDSINLLECCENYKNLWFDLEGVSRFVAKDLRKHALKLDQLADKVKVQ